LVHSNDMSTFWTKIERGQSPTEADWAEHLIEAHEGAPSMTPRAFAAHKTKDGFTSYEFLARQVSGLGADIAVVDLACGDGYLAQFLLPRLGAKAKLFGVDMSEAELDAARRQVRDPRASFLRAEARRVPLESQSVDAVLCHMAFMLMSPVEPAVAELSRVLKGGGRFAAVTGNPKGSRGPYAEIQKLVSQFLVSRYPKIKDAKAGDGRVNTLEGLGELFRRDRGFDEPIDLGEFWLEVSTDPEGLWDFMKDMYFVGMLPAREKGELRLALVGFAAANAANDGKLRFEFPMRGFAAVRSGG
jgi:SAM-dependent methyltransferase